MGGELGVDDHGCAASWASLTFNYAVASDAATDRQDILT